MQEFLHGITTLSQSAVTIGEPAAALLDDTIFHTKINNLTHLGDTLAEGDFEFTFAERRCHLVLHHLYAHLVTDYLVTILDACNTTDIQTNRCIELQGITACGSLRITEHHTDLLTQLVDEDTGGIGLGDGRSEFTQCLTHQSGLQAHHVITHLTLNLLLRCKGCHGVDHQDINR